MRGIVSRIIELLDSSEAISSTEIARVAGISRQATHKQLRRLLRAGVIASTGKARACRYSRAVQSAAVSAPLRTHLEVASTGSLFRLSARLLLCGVQSGELTLDFKGVFDVGDEFLEEIFLLLAPAHDRVTLKVQHLPSRFAAKFFELARNAQQQSVARIAPLAPKPEHQGPDRRRRHG